ncbi:hypothetical protein TL16_g05952 [Triparma laevis f. inornata]|uniref:Uncharacterized protein n=2 Tax=Triparma laevis TaxID=1534972 RepID=A0A9W7KRL8_9STRA|nr:hypothetical protein TL16_g05952 [Triparma laevis f. inornata]GMI09184.1 hypothetical protein TrLO_g12381 [Triparma laevis f. longispina]
MVFLEDGQLSDFYDVVPPSMVLFLLCLNLTFMIINGFSISYTWTYFLITWYFKGFLLNPIGRWWRIGRGEGKGFENDCDWYEYYALAKKLEDVETLKLKENEILERRLREERRIENMTGRPVRRPVIVRTRQGQVVPPLPNDPNESTEN